MVVLDTNVVSYIFNRDPRAHYYQERIQGQRVLISFQTLEEQWYGAYMNGWGERRRNELAHYLDLYEVVWPNAELVETCAQLRVERKEAGRKLEVADAWIAATALMLDCPLASHDRDFSGIAGLTIIKATSP